MKQNEWGGIRGEKHEQQLLGWRNNKTHMAREREGKRFDACGHDGVRRTGAALIT